MAVVQLVSAAKHDVHWPAEQVVDQRRPAPCCSVPDDNLHPFCSVQIAASDVLQPPHHASIGILLQPSCAVPIAASDVLEPLPPASVDALPQPSCAVLITAAVLPSVPLAYLYLSVSDVASLPFDVLQPMSRTDLEHEQQADSVV
jgi:hypothetical protein